MDLMLAAKALYDRWCTAHKGHNPDGSPMRCWEALDGNTRATWTAVAETAYHHVLKHLDPTQAPAIEEYVRDLLAVLLTLAGQTSGVTTTGTKLKATTTALVNNGLGAARVEVTVTCGDQVHRLAYEQAVVNLTMQPGSRGAPERLQLELTGSRVNTPSPMPAIIPAGAANALGLGELEAADGTLPWAKHAQDLHAADWPELRWDHSPYAGGTGYWRRVDWPICAVQRPDGTWERQSATY